MACRLLDKLDVYGTDDPDFNEGQPEDVCPLCDWPVIEHPGHAFWRDQIAGPAALAKWPHRRAAAIALLFG